MMTIPLLSASNAIEPVPGGMALLWSIALLFGGAWAAWRIIRAEGWLHARTIPFAAIRGWGREIGMSERFIIVAGATIAAFVLTPMLLHPSTPTHVLNKETFALLGMTGQLAALTVMLALTPRINPGFRFQTAPRRELLRWRDTAPQSTSETAATTWRAWHPVAVTAAAIVLTALVSQAQILLDTCVQKLTGISLGLNEIQNNVKEIAAGRDNLPFLLLCGISAVLLAPIVEELFFRGLIYPFLKERFRANKVLSAALLTGAFFGLIHASLAAFLPLALFGALLCLTYERTRDIRGPIAVHALFNLNTFLTLIAS